MPLPLLEADALEITILVDNQIDMLLPGDEQVVRHPYGPRVYNPILEDDVTTTLHAEHGFSALVTLIQDGAKRHILFDAGVSANGLIENMDRLELDSKDIEAVVLSHGHFDHTGGLAGLVDRLGRVAMPMIIHPGAYTKRRSVPPGRLPTPLPPPSRTAMEGAGFELLESADPSLLFEDRLLVTGEVPRATDFEQGFPFFQSQDAGGEWHPEPHLMDDQAVIANVKGRGLVVLTGCGHAGIVNIVRRAQALTGVDQVHAVLGGFHLSGPFFEPIIAPTIEALRGFAPSLVVPGHCTGYKPQMAIAQALPEAYVHNAVGTTYRL
ncbi:MAG: MBL fold metallo-hydrolase [Dehalococcoidia bacterium]|nr:MBL fold metallo-hydrolase [Dehalococcoidia bacterium]